MAKKRHTPEQVINRLREAEGAMAEGSTVAEAARRIGVTDQTFYRWRSEYGGLRIFLYVAGGACAEGAV